MVLIEPCAPGQQPHVLRKSAIPPPPVRYGEHMAAEVGTLIQLLPAAVRDALARLQEQVRRVSAHDPANQNLPPRT